MKVLTDVKSKNTADRYLHAQEGDNMKDQTDEMFAETEQWKEVVGNLQILQYYNEQYYNIEQYYNEQYYNIEQYYNEQARNSTVRCAFFRLGNVWRSFGRLKRSICANCSLTTRIYFLQG